MKESEALEQAVQYLLEIPDRAQKLSDAVNEADLERTDLLHFLEMRKEADADRVIHLLREASVRRREAKDALEILEPLLKWVERNQKEIRLLSETLGKMRKQEERQETRIYHRRTAVLDGMIEEEWFGKE